MHTCLLLVGSAVIMRVIACCCDQSYCWVQGHKEDIVSVTMSRPNWLATSGYDGMVIIWNMISGRTLGHLVSPPVPGYVDSSRESDGAQHNDPDGGYQPVCPGDGDMSVNKLIFIQRRNLNKDAASLVASGPRGYVHFWNIYRGGVLFGRFKAVSASTAWQMPN